MPITLADGVIGRLRQCFVDSCCGEEERLFQWYVAPFGADSEYAGAAQHYPLLERFPQAIQESGQRSFLILGDSGLGKTTLSLWLCRHFLANLATQQRLPIYIHLPGVVSKDGTLPGDILDTFLHSRFNKTERLAIRQQSLLLLLDGYDEITDRRTNIYTSNHWHERQYDIKIVTSCRPEALRELNIATLFETAVDARVPATLATKYKPFYLQAFNEAQIKDYLRAFLVNPSLKFREQYSGTAWLEAGHYSEWLERLPALKTLATTPFLLSMIVQALPQMVDRYDGRDAISQATLTQTDIFEAFVNSWFSYQAARLQKSEQLPWLSHKQICSYLKAYAQNLAASLLDITGHLGQEVMEDERTLIPHLAVPLHDEELLGEYERAHKCRFANPDMVDLRALRAGCLLRTEGGNFRFLHKSLVEFLAARELFAGLQGEYDLHIQEGLELSRRESLPALNRQLIKEPQMIARLVERVQANESFKKLLCQIVESSKETAGISTMAANAITILNAARFSFSGLDLRDIQIPGADLSYALCSNTDFRGANLEEVSFAQAQLSQARFQGANCANMYFGEKPFLSHPSEVNAVAHYNTPTDSYLLAGCSDGYVYQWHSQTQVLYRTYNHGRTFIGRTNVVRCLAVTYGEPSCRAINSSHYLATGGGKGNYIYIWSLQTGRYFPRLNGHECGINSLAFSPSGEWLASASDDNTVRLWRMPDRSVGPVLRGHANSILSISFLPNGEWLASGSCDCTVRLWHMPDGSSGPVLQDHENLGSFSFAPNGEWLASGNGTNVRLWHMPDGAAGPVLQGHTEKICSVSFSSNGEWLASGSADNTVRLWRMPDGAVGPVLLGHTKEVYSVSFTPDGKWLTSASGDKTVRLWQHTVAALKRTIKPQLQVYTDRVSSVSFSPDGEWLASGSADNTVRLWHMSSGIAGPVLHGHAKMICSISFSPNGEWLASGGADNTVRLWHMPDGSIGPMLHEHTNDVYSISFSPDGEWLASGSADNTVRLWRMPNGTVGPVLQGLTKEGVLNVSFSPDGKWLASRIRGRAQLWHMPSGVVGPVLSTELCGAISLSFASKDCWLMVSVGIPPSNSQASSAFLASICSSVASGSTLTPLDVSFSISILTILCAQTVELRHMPSGISGPTLRGTPMSVSSVSFAPNSNWLAVAGTDFPGFSSFGNKYSTVHLWHMPEEACSQIIPLWYSVSSIAFSPKEMALAVAGESGDLSLISFANNEAAQWRLNWTHGQPGLDLRRLHITQAMGLSGMEKNLCEQRGAEGQPAPAGQQYRPLYTLFQPIAESVTASNWVESLLPAVNARHLRISENLWCVSVAVKRTRTLSRSWASTMFRWSASSSMIDQRTMHAFLIIEGLKNRRRFVIRAELTTPGESKVVIDLKPLCDRDGRPEHSFDHFKESVKSYHANQWSINKDQGKKLLSNIRADQQAALAYALINMDGGLGTKHHNCVSWCRKQLRQIGLNPPESWLEHYVQLPSALVAPPAESEARGSAPS